MKKQMTFLSLRCSYSFSYSKTGKHKQAAAEDIGVFNDHLPVGRKQTSKSKLILIRDWLIVKGNIAKLL